MLGRGCWRSRSHSWGILHWFLCKFAAQEGEWERKLGTVTVSIVCYRQHKTWWNWRSRIWKIWNEILVWCLGGWRMKISCISWLIGNRRHLLPSIELPNVRLSNVLTLLDFFPFKPFRGPKKKQCDCPYSWHNRQEQNSWKHRAWIGCTVHIPLHHNRTEP